MTDETGIEQLETETGDALALARIAHARSRSRPGWSNPVEDRVTLREITVSTWDQEKKPFEVTSHDGGAILLTREAAEDLLVALGEALGRQEGPLPDARCDAVDEPRDRRSTASAGRRAQIDRLIDGLRGVATVEPGREAVEVGVRSSPCVYCWESGPLAGEPETRHAKDCEWIAVRRAFDSMTLSG